MSMRPGSSCDFTGGRSTAPGSVASVDLMMGTLAVRRFCHGLIKFTIYPDQYNKRAREALTGYRRAVRVSDADAHKLKLKRIASQYTKDMENAHVKRGVALSVAKNFNGDMPKAVGKKYRKKAFTYNGAITVNEVGQIAEEKYGKSAIFLTGTVPGSMPGINDVIADYSAYIVNRVREWFRKWFKEPYSLINVWEFQTKKRLMLHIHIAIFSHEKAVLEKIMREWKQRWNKLLLDVSKKSGVDVFRRDEKKTWRDDLNNTRQDAQWVKFSVSRYLAKYLSKAARDDASHSAAHPSRWWGVDSATRREAQARRVVVKVAGVPVGELKKLLGKIFCEMREDAWDIVMREKSDVPGVSFGGKFWEPEKSEVVLWEIFRILGTVCGGGVDAVVGVAS